MKRTISLPDKALVELSEGPCRCSLTATLAGIMMEPIYTCVKGGGKAGENRMGQVFPDAARRAPEATNIPV
jgi:hypothetical protein